MKAEKNLTRKQWNYGAESWNDFVENGKDFGKKIIAPGIMKLLPKKGRATGKESQTFTLINFAEQLMSEQ